MRYGDKDGFKEIYDDKGELILQPNERILVTEENVIPSFKSTWRYYGGEYLLEPSKGTIYLTNERLVFINIPERLFAVGGSDGARAVDAPVGSAFELGDMSPGAAVREFVEIPNIEIMASEKKEGAVSVGIMVNVYILSSGNQFHFSMVLTSDSDLLIRLMNKQVNDLDQLVNNLKDFFSKTDWIFMEGEKKVYGSTQNAVLPEPKIEPSRNASSSEVSPQTRKGPNVSRSQITAPINTSRRIPISTEVGTRSMDYFENLYNKGLIKEEIYRKLVNQLNIGKPIHSIVESKTFPPLQVDPDTIGSAGNDDLQGSKPTNDEDRVPDAEPVEPEQPPVDPEADIDLLSMLNDTLSDLVPDETPSPESSGEEVEKVPKQRVVKARKVRRSPS